MSWEVVEVDRGSKTKSLPSASVGYGRISLNVAACYMLNDYDQYKYAELLTDTQRPSLVGIKFLINASQKSIAIKRKTANGKIVGGVELTSKSHTEKLFGINGIQKKATNYPVTKEAENILVIHIN